MNRYDIFNQPYRIGGVEIKNRFAVVPMTMGALTYDEQGGFSDNFIHYLELRAKGGFALIIPGAATTDRSVDPYAALGPNVIESAHWQERAKVLTETIHNAGAKIFCQITMGLGRNYPGLPGPSENPVWRNPDMKSPALTVEQIHSKIADMIEAATVAQACGYDGVEIHAMHWGYLLDQMAMSFYNRREDEYGGSLENRLRCAREIVEGIHDKCGRDFPVGMRLGLKTYIRDYDKATLTGEGEVGRTLEEGVEISRLLEKYGYNYLNTDTGTYDSFYYACPPMYNPQGFMIPLAAAAKKAVSIPVMAGGRMQDYDLAAAAIEAGEIDAVGLGRPSLADPDYPNKVISGMVEDIRPCIGCNMGCFRRCVETGEPVSCAVNPQAARELVVGLKPGEGNKKVVVIGGGVAGMEAARTSALRGYAVTLFEKGDHLGGHIVEAGAHDFKKEIARLNAWYKRELDRLGVKVELNHEPCINCVKKQSPDAVILATGTTPAMPPIPGLEKAVTSLDAINQPEKLGKTVVIIGGGLVGCEIALDAANRGKDVTVVEALDD
ncbi:MAG: FAD-dependent oxidoreductase, partial [Clostridia bacterium]|nr:FAD-dependent oxidoreductase [Clostridia bacterium]